MKNQQKTKQSMQPQQRDLIELNKMVSEWAIENEFFYMERKNRTRLNKEDYLPIKAHNLKIIDEEP